MNFDLEEYGGSVVPFEGEQKSSMRDQLGLNDSEISDDEISQLVVDDAKEQKRLADRALVEKAALASERDRLAQEKAQIAAEKDRIAREKQMTDVDLANTRSTKNLLQNELDLERNRRLYGVDKVVLDMFGRPVIPFRSSSTIGDYFTKERIKNEVKDELLQEKREKARQRQLYRPRRSPAKPRSKSKSKSRSKSKTKSKTKAKSKK